MSGANRSFDKVLETELVEIQEARVLDACASTPVELGNKESISKESDPVSRDTLHGAAWKLCLTGIALSGGGIRSATFNLGVLQWLSEAGLLRRFDYLSTVSGGNYIGTWLSGLIKRTGGRVAGAEQKLKGDGCKWSASAGDGPEEVSFLRSYSNFLSPLPGVFSADTWTAVAIYLRSTLLNQTLLVAFLALLLLVPQIAESSFRFLDDQRSISNVHWWIAGAVVLSMGWAVFAIAWNLDRLRVRRVSPEKQQVAQAAEHSQAVVLLNVLLPGWIAASLLSWGMFYRAFNPIVKEYPWLHSLNAHWEGAAWFVTGTIGYSLLWLFALMFRSREAWGKRFYNFIWALAAGALLGGLLYCSANFLIPEAAGETAPKRWLAVCFGPILMLTVFSLTIVLHVGLAGRLLAEEDREWWGRLGAWTMLACLVWGGLCAVSVLGPPLFAWSKEVASALGVGWILTTLAGVLSAKSGATGGAKEGKDSKLLPELLAHVAPYVFVAGLLIAVALVLQLALGVKPGTEPSQAESKGVAVETCVRSVHKTEDRRQEELKCDTQSSRTFTEIAKDHTRGLSDVEADTLFLAILVCGLIVLIFGWRIDINLFSFHQFYRNRLTRCYLGASIGRERRPDPFTGIDPQDDLPLAELAEWKKDTREPDVGKVQRPYHIVNTALNLTTGGSHLAWQQRKAASFAFTPRFCGFQFPPSAELDSARTGGYVWTNDYMNRNGPGPMLGSLMAVSGAAASPNSGYHTSATVAFLLTMFNVRLGRWCSNSAKNDPEILKQESPRFGFRYLLKELFAAADEQSNFVYLSDGGHFDNLGVYELLRRRCVLIVACDGSADPTFGLEDLGNTIRKCRVDLGIEIDMDTRALLKIGETRYNRYHCAVGKIKYPEFDDGRQHYGTFVYIKTTLTGDEPGDVLEYAGSHPDFPHEPTSDQFFDEMQFESYRKLGYHAARAVLECVLDGETRIRNEKSIKAGHALSQCEWIGVRHDLYDRWYAPAVAAAGAFSRHGSALKALVDQLRGESSLRPLAREVYDGQAWSGEFLQDQESSILLACSNALQLMENVYIDLNLEDPNERNHPDNKGWIALFRKWGSSALFRRAWKEYEPTYGTRFQAFCSKYVIGPQDDRSDG